MAKKVGTLIKEARTAAGLTQAALAKKVKGVSASDISQAEHGEKELTQAALKEIAKATGVTQKSLLDAAKQAGSSKKTSSNSASSKKTSSGKKTSESSFKVSTEEKKLIQAYREADSKVQTAVKMMLLGTTQSGSGTSQATDLIGSLLNSVRDWIK